MPHKHTKPEPAPQVETNITIVTLTHQVASTGTDQYRVNINPKFIARLGWRAHQKLFLELTPHNQLLIREIKAA
jgi:hypothetical protein